MPNQLTNPPRFFVSYSHKDEEFKDDLKTHLSSLIRNKSISSWDDREIPIGGEWDKNIKSELTNADVILLLISSDFLNSSYCNDVEVARAMERHNDPNDPAVVVPIILRHCDWTDSPFAKLQALPKNAKPITSYGDKDEAYLFIVKQIKSLIKSKYQSPAASAGSPSVASNPTGTAQQPVAQPAASAPATPVSHGAPDVNEIRTLIAESKTEKAIAAMLEYANQNDPDNATVVIMQSGRFNSAKKSNMMGTLSSDDYNRTIAQVNYALLEILNSF